MATKIKFTKGELKRQRDSLQQFEHYLPILQLKKKQLQLELQHVHERLRVKKEEIIFQKELIKKWSGLLNEADEHFKEWIKPKKVIVGTSNIAGIDIPVLEKVEFEELEYDLFIVPLWVDIAIDRLRAFVVRLEEERILKRQADILADELRITTQRVNLFEKVKIPEAKENIRVIKIYLGDQDTNAVGRSKMAKNKLARFSLRGVSV